MKIKRITLTAMLVAVAMVLSYVETLIPIFTAVPGMKIGLTNIVVLVALFYMDAAYAFGINMVRIVLVAFTFGNMFALMYSLAGGLLSFAVMVVLKKTGKFSYVGISVAGAAAHNIGQIIVAIFVLGTAQIAYYLPILLVTGVISGCLVGIVCGEVIKRLPKDI